MLRTFLNYEVSIVQRTRVILQYYTCIFAMDEPQFFAEYAKQGRAKCKNCKEKIEKSVLRIGRLVPNPFGDDGGTMKEWYHMPCMFDKLSRTRTTTKRIEKTEEVDGFADLQEDDKQSIRKYISGIVSDFFNILVVSFS